MTYLGGSGAAGTATIAGGMVTAVTLSSGGTGYSGTPPETIPAGGTLSVPLTITDSLMVNDLTVGLDITDANDANLSIALTDQAGTTVQLLQGGSGANLVNTIFDDNATAAVSATTGPYTGSFHAEQEVRSAVDAAGGTGYVIGDVLDVVGGTFTTQAQLTVTSVSGTGAVTGVSILTAGAYSVEPYNAAAVTDTTTPAATGATVNLSYGALSLFNGANYQGTWKLTITNTGAATGTLNGWSLNPFTVTPVNPGVGTAAIANVAQNGSGYKVGNVLTVQGGASTTSAQLTVDSVTANGAILTFTISRPGSYSVNPANPAAVTGGAGSGAEFDLVMASIGQHGFVASAAIANVPQSGQGYAVGDVLTVDDGTFTNPAQLTVTSVDANGAILAFTITQAGSYSVEPSSPDDNVVDTTDPGEAIAAAIVGKGSGYKVNDLLTVLGGTFSTPVELQVSTIGAGGTITGVTIFQAGDYGILPANPVSVTDLTTPAGTGATFKLTWTGATGAEFNLAFGSTFQIGFPTQTASGTYSFVYGPDSLANYIKDTQLNTGTLANGGSGYNVGDVLTVIGGTATTAAAQFTVAAVNASGTITAIELLQPGSYSVMPANPVATTDSGSGINATLNLDFGNEVDTNMNAGVALLEGGNTINGTLLPNVYLSGTIDTPIPADTTTDSTINVPSSYLVEGVTLSLTILHKNDPDLTATLIAPNGTAVQLFTDVGTTGVTPHANFTDTTFADTALNPIQQAATQGGGIGIGMGPWDPQFPLSKFIGLNALGNWTLQILSNSSSLVGTLVDWSVTIENSVPGSGLGEQIADQFTTSFRIFTQAPTNAIAQNQWTAVGPLPMNDGTSAGKITAVAVDAADPSGNTVYAAAVNGGVWKTTNFLTTAANGPIWQPLTDTGPGDSLDVDSIAIFDRNNDPDQSIIYAATGSVVGGLPGVGVLCSTDGGKTWTILSNNNLFVGTTIYQVTVDPTAQPNGQVIVYAAVSGGGAARPASGAAWMAGTPGPCCKRAPRRPSCCPPAAPAPTTTCRSSTAPSRARASITRSTRHRPTV